MDIPMILGKLIPWEGTPVYATEMGQKWDRNARLNKNLSVVRIVRAAHPRTQIRREPPHGEINVTWRYATQLRLDYYPRLITPFAIPD